MGVPSAAVWLKAAVAVDQRDRAKAEHLFSEVVHVDRDIDTKQQASLETDKIVLELREERRKYSVTCP